MKWQIGKRFWVVLTLVILIFTLFVVGRNLMHALAIHSDIKTLEGQRDKYQESIEADSALLEGLRYDDILEKFARERYRMQRLDEKVYVTE